VGVVRVGVMRAGLGLALAASLSACATDGSTTQSAGNWTIQRSIDRITNAPTARVYVRTMVLNRRGELDWIKLQLACFNGKPIVHIAFNARIGTQKNAVVQYRFDANPGRQANAEILTDHRTVVIEAKDEMAKFIGELATSSVLLVRVVSLTDVRTEVEFRVAGAPVAIEAAYANCPLPQAATAAR
jgi:hypothetical protein